MKNNKLMEFLKAIFAPTPKALPKEINPGEVPRTEPAGATEPPAHKDNPAYLEAKKHDGKKETDSKFNKYLSGFWRILGLTKYKTIVGSSFAWCGLFIAAMNTETGLSYIAKGAAARNWAKYGQMVDWKTNGIPKGAVVHINHGLNCSSSKKNHVTFADGDCTAEELLKSGATFPGFGGNQQNTVNRSSYDVRKICEVRWPSEIELPKKIKKSVNCKSSKDENGSTR